MNEIIKKAVNPSNNKNLIYNDKEHTYRIIEDDKYLISSTTFIKKFFKPFDSDKFSKIIAKRENNTQEAILEKWALKRDSSSAYGTEVHEYGEALFKKELPSRPSSMRVRIAVNHVTKIVDQLLEEWDVVGIEKIIFNDYIAGTIDFLLKHKYEENRYMIGDWKTNEKIVKENKYNNFGLYPIEHIVDNNYYHYTLQLSLYQKILMEEGYIPKESKIERNLFHINPIFTSKIKLLYLDKEIDDMINCYFKKSSII